MSEYMVAKHATEKILTMRRGSGIIECWMGLDRRWYPLYNWPKPPEFFQYHWLLAEGKKLERWGLMTRLEHPGKAPNFVEFDLSKCRRRPIVIYEEELEITRHEGKLVPVKVQLPKDEAELHEILKRVQDL